MGSDTKQAASYILLSATLVSDLLHLPAWEVKPIQVGITEMTWGVSKTQSKLDTPTVPGNSSKSF